MVKTVDALQDERKKQNKNEASNYFVHRLVCADSKAF